MKKSLLLALVLSIAAGTAARAETWAERTLRGMTLEEKVGQLLMLSVFAGWDKTELDATREAIRLYKPGGLIFYRADSKTHVGLVNEMQGLSGQPLLIALDAEWGLSMRLSDAIRFPRNMTLGALTDDGLLRSLGSEIGRELRVVGVHLNLAPDVDVNNNPKNPIINDRSFGENPQKVAAKGASYMLGIQAAGVLACAKHFPGHGDTDVDSHLDLPRIPHPRERFDRVEFIPFKKQIEDGVAAVMIAHLSVPALESDANRPVSLSSQVITGLLRRELGFGGLVVSDALAMAAITKAYPGGQAMAEAAFAGTDVLLLGSDNGKILPVLSQQLPDGFKRIAEAVRSGRLPEAELDQRVLRILRAKEALGLDRERLVPAENLSDKLMTAGAMKLKKDLYRKALTLVRNDGDFLPLRLGRKIAHVQIGAPPRLRGLHNRFPWFFRRSAYTPFAKALAERIPFSAFYASSRPTPDETRRMIERLSGYDAVIVSIQGMTRKAAEGYGLTAEGLDMLARVRASRKPTALVVFGNPYSLALAGPQTAVLVAYEDDPEAQAGAAEVVSGALKAEGRLPVTASQDFPEGSGL
ncbi:MAG: glycoside hydrolase family 3 C-terminal domain-containing protein [Elusimicrobia bacterium]|nr:glycoside hydrolase family 3 C-terminal domain-containing protein [Elusimicrobiota bacterium]